MNKICIQTSSFSVSSFSASSEPHHQAPGWQSWCKRKHKTDAKKTKNTKLMRKKQKNTKLMQKKTQNWCKKNTKLMQAFSECNATPLQRLQDWLPVWLGDSHHGHHGKDDVDVENDNYDDGQWWSSCSWTRKHWDRFWPRFSRVEVAHLSSLQSGALRLD